MSEFPKSWAHYAAKRGSGMCTTGQGLGVFVGLPDAARNCPAGWIFVACEPEQSEEALVSRIQEALAAASDHRSTWPARVRLTKSGDIVEENIE